MIYCNKCDKRILFCTCDDVKERLIYLVQSDRVYIGKVIMDRISLGLSTENDFVGLNIHHPFNSFDEVLKGKTLSDYIGEEKANAICDKINKNNK